eukprot:scaffold363_cov56-Cylindrotheca_fusiformis.AAC.5
MMTYCLLAIETDRKVQLRQNGVLFGLLVTVMNMKEDELLISKHDYLVRICRIFTPVSHEVELLASHHHQSLCCKRTLVRVELLC